MKSFNICHLLHLLHFWFLKIVEDSIPIAIFSISRLILCFTDILHLDAFPLKGLGSGGMADSNCAFYKCVHSVLGIKLMTLASWVPYFSAWATGTQNQFFVIFRHHSRILNVIENFCGLFGKNKVINQCPTRQTSV